MMRNTDTVSDGFISCAEIKRGTYPPVLNQFDVYRHICFCTTRHFHPEVCLNLSSVNIPHSHSPLLEDHFYFCELFISLALDPVI